ncbi:Sulfate adenylyltransferase, small subunit [Oceanospirillum sp. MED92]|uniref:Sulfate adenylyltransferase subunit 2 n=2 Tax=Neptuniibacter caesariensis TaxID=207954 RepID=A0A7U8C2X3_NEPCE|nr:Sulfate adenylyltransferase, small subunit [Oceanospirillum sp. MED92] [Neptuniibacter caesariensis]
MTDFSKLINEKQRTAWTTRSISNYLWSSEEPSDLKKTERWLAKHSIDFTALAPSFLRDEHERPAKSAVISQILELSRRKRKTVLFASIYSVNMDCSVLFANDGRAGRRWVFIPSSYPSSKQLEQALSVLAEGEDKDITLIPSGLMVQTCREIAHQKQTHDFKLKTNSLRISLEIYSHGKRDISAYVSNSEQLLPESSMSHLDRLEAEAIHIIREVVAEADNPVMLYSVGKDSSVMLHLARKAFYPSLPPFPLLHVDTRWKFQAMYDFRDYMAETSGMDLLVHINPEGVEKNINPLDHGSALHTDIMKTQGLKQALDHYNFDVAFGGARRDEEKSRAKERIFSFRTSTHRWDPKNQRPELWHQYNGRKKPDESMRVFPLSNWTELDIWQYIYREQIPIVPLYFATDRPVVERDGMLVMIDDNRLKLYPDEKIFIKKVRFRTLGCYPLTGAIESDANDLASIVLELLSARTSERQGRAIDSDSSASMEMKKQEGYF